VTDTHEWAPPLEVEPDLLLDGLLERARRATEDGLDALSTADIVAIVREWVDDRDRDPERERLLNRIMEVDGMIADYIRAGKV
jgi:hypothetical protein